MGNHWIVASGQSPVGLAWRKDSKGRIWRRDTRGHTTREVKIGSGVFEDGMAADAEGFIDWEPVT